MIRNEGEWRPLVELRRDGVTEVVVHGAVAWVDPDGDGYTFGNPVVFGRSILKPFQLAAHREPGDGLTPEQIAIACASHAGGAGHLKAAKSLLAKGAWDDLKLPAVQPLGEHVRSPTPWHHPCSGKHAALLAACLRREWSTDYLAADHPFHAAVLRTLRLELGEAWTPAVVAADGCGLPTYALALGDVARLFRGLAVAYAREQDSFEQAPEQKALAEAWSAMLAFPDLVGGPGRLDTLITQVSEGHVVAKEGADGLLAAASYGGVIGARHSFCIKVAHGTDPRLTQPIARACVGALGLSELPPEPIHGQSIHVNEALLPPELRERGGEFLVTPAGA